MSYKHSWSAFEKLIYDSFYKRGYLIKKLDTSVQKQVSDFVTFCDGKLLFLEAKSTRANSFPFSMVKAHQAIGLHGMSAYKHVHGGLMIDMRKHSRIFYVPVQSLQMALTEGKASMTIQDLESMGIEVYKKDGLLDLSFVEEL